MIILIIIFMASSNSSSSSSSSAPLREAVVPPSPHGLSITSGWTNLKQRVFKLFAKFAHPKHCNLSEICVYVYMLICKHVDT